MFKAYVLFGQQEYLDLFNEAFSNVLKMMQKPTIPYLFANVDMQTGSISNMWVDSLQAYVGGLLASTGEVRGAVLHHQMYYNIWKKFGAMPERFNLLTKMPEVSVYPLRPELMESTFTLYRATKDPLYVEIGRELMCDLQATAATCGYATLHNVVTKEQEDRMESFFLSETLKYLYLLSFCSDRETGDKMRSILANRGDDGRSRQLPLRRDWVQSHALGKRRQAQLCY